MIEIYQPGQTVLIGPIDDAVEAVVTEVLLKSPDCEVIQYNVAWWDGRTRHEKWLEGHEVRNDPGARTCTIGFKGESK